MTVFDVIRNSLLAGLGIQETVKDFLDELVKRGELSESQGAKLLREWSKKAGKTSDQLSKNISEIISKTLLKMNLPTRDDMGKLNKEISSLSARLGKLESIIKESQKNG